MSNIDFVIKKDHKGRGWIIKIKNREYSKHSHFRTKQGCYKLMKLIINNKLPKDSYFQEAAHRILYEEEFANLINKDKQKYYNKKIKRHMA